MNIPKELKYSRNHEWVRIEGRLATIGITDYAQAQLGDVVFVELPEVGKVVARGEGCAVVESVKAVSDIYAPVAGQVVAGNEALADSPETVNREPYGSGWIAVLQLNDDTELSELLDKTAYEQLLLAEEN